MNTIIVGDCLLKLKELAENSIDAIVTDPPYGLEFMGKDWDKGVPGVHFWQEMIRVLKPGGHLLAFGGTRTYHRMAVAIEDAGFEVRDMIEWIYGSGFPKSLNIGKAVDKLQGNERNIVQERKFGARDGSSPTAGASNGGQQGGYNLKDERSITKGTSEWEGWGTALKPAHEPICMARKPLSEKTVAENVLKYGTGGLNIDESRVGYISEKDKIEGQSARTSERKGNNQVQTSGDRSDRSDITGRFPANLIHDNSEEVRGCFPESNSGKGKASTYEKFGGQWGKGKQIRNEDYGDKGNASRFFKSIIYQAKASKSERNKGCEELEEKERIDYGGFHSEKGLIENNRNPENRKPTTNNHPTVKPIALMEYLIKMVTREGQLVLDPFMGSGSTGVACKRLLRDFIGIEMEPEYAEIARHRIDAVVDRLL